MKVLHINTTDLKGGAARVAQALMGGALANGDQAGMVVKEKYSKDARIMPVQKTIRGAGLFSRLSRNIFKKDLVSFVRYRLREAAELVRSLPANDLNSRLFGKAGGDIRLNEWNTLHLHNLHGGYFNLNDLAALGRKNKLVWTLHDMWAITGHCAHSFDCDRWQTGCGRCPYLKIYPPLLWDRTADLWKKKISIYEKTNIDVVVPSKWLYDKVRLSILRKQRLHLIYNGIDTALFMPLDKKKAREELDLPAGKKIVLYMSPGGKQNHWKGWEYFQAMARQFSDNPDVLFVCIGAEPDRNRDVGKNIAYLDYEPDQRKIAKLYNAAEVFLFPSLAENFPLAVLEAMSCGTPVLSFDVGGVKEVLVHKENGYLARYKNFDDLAKGLSHLLSISENERRAMAEASRQKIAGNFSLDKMAEQYLSLYRSLGS